MGGVETTQSIVSVLCQTTFLFLDRDINDPLMTTQAKSLFGLNISFSVMTVVLSTITVFLKEVFLRKDKQESITSLELPGVYRNDNTDTAPMQENPLRDQNPDDMSKSMRDSDASPFSKNKEVLQQEVQDLESQDEEAPQQHEIENKDTGIDIGHVYRHSATDIVPMQLNPMRDPENNDSGNNYDKNEITAVQSENMSLKSKNA